VLVVSLDVAVVGKFGDGDEKATVDNGRCSDTVRSFQPSLEAAQSSSTLAYRVNFITIHYSCYLFSSSSAKITSATPTLTMLLRSFLPSPLTSHSSHSFHSRLSGIVKLWIAFDNEKLYGLEPMPIHPSCCKFTFSSSLQLFVGLNLTSVQLEASVFSRVLLEVF
jgi:hypothetical protein